MSRYYRLRNYSTWLGSPTVAAVGPGTRPLLIPLTVWGPVPVCRRAYRKGENGISSDLSYAHAQGQRKTATKKKKEIETRNRLCSGGENQRSSADGRKSEKNGSSFVARHRRCRCRRCRLRQSVLEITPGFVPNFDFFHWWRFRVLVPTGVRILTTVVPKLGRGTENFKKKKNVIYVYITKPQQPVRSRYLLDNFRFQIYK